MEIPIEDWVKKRMHLAMRVCRQRELAGLAFQRGDMGAYRRHLENAKDAEIHFRDLLRLRDGPADPSLTIARASESAILAAIYSLERGYEVADAQPLTGEAVPA